MSNQTNETYARIQSGDDEELNSLLGAAGPRDEVPAADLAEIRAVAKENWREMVAMERQRARFRRARNLFALAASVVLAVAIGWWLKPDGSTVPVEIVARVEVVRGGAAAGDTALVVGGQLEAGALIDTSEPSAPARLSLRLHGGQSVRIDEGSRLRLASGSRLSLDRGAVYVDTAGSIDGTGLEIDTPFGVVRDIGTQFEVRLSRKEGVELTLRVREGEVSLEERSGRAHSALAGEELEVGGDRLDRRPVGPDDVVWSWAEAVAPPMKIEGASLRAYLEWVSRETGRELRFATAALAESSESIVVHGSIEGMTPEQSLEVVLPGSGLAYRVENGSLLIAKP